MIDRAAHGLAVQRHHCTAQHRAHTLRPARQTIPKRLWVQGLEHAGVSVVLQVRENHRWLVTVLPIAQVQSTAERIAEKKMPKTDSAGSQINPAGGPRPIRWF